MAMSIAATIANTFTNTFAAGVCAVETNVTAEAVGAGVETIATTATAHAAVIAVRSTNGPHERAVAMICRFRDWNAAAISCTAATVATTFTTATAANYATPAATATAYAADTAAANEVDVSADAVSTSVTAAIFTATPVAVAPVATHVSVNCQHAEPGAWLARIDEVMHISTACKGLSRNRVDVAGVVLLGWTLRYRMRSTGTTGDWYATSPDGIRYRSHKELQRRV